MSGPRISIIVAVKNGISTIERCIKSTTEQTFTERELIVIDGGSTDGTVDVLRRHDRDLAVWQSEPDRGLYHAWNKGIACATGDWICFLGADDRFHDCRVLSQVAERLARLSPSQTLAYGRILLVSEAGLPVGELGAPWETLASKFRNGLMRVPHPGLMHRREVFDRGLFDDSFRMAADYDLLLREVLLSTPVFMPDLTVAVVQKGGISDVRRHRLQLLLETQRARNKNGLRDVPPRFIVGFITGVPQTVVGTLIHRVGIWLR